jgi:hypothetical protein
VTMRKIGAQVQAERRAEFDSSDTTRTPGKQVLVWTLMYIRAMPSLKNCSCITECHYTFFYRVICYVTLRLLNLSVIRNLKTLPHPNTL